MKKLLLAIGIILLFAAEILKVYFIMPFPGSQHNNTIDIAYFLHTKIIYIRIIALLCIAYGLYGRLGKWKIWQKLLLGFVTALYLFIFYACNYYLLADKMFYQPRIKNFAEGKGEKVNDQQLVIGVELNGQAKAYPIEIIGYHHQVKDTLGGKPIIVTYCTVCRTGRVYSPMVDNKYETFRLVGMDHFNAMFEDATTKSWWRQATGEAIAGPLKGKLLEEIPSAQMSLQSWLQKKPGSFVLQPDSNFKKQYKDLAGFDNGTIKGSLEKRDSASWHFKSWVIGIQYKDISKAYDWNELVSKWVINDSIPQLPVMIALEPDSVTFHAWSRSVNGQSLVFTMNKDRKLLSDSQTGSVWNFEGVCIEGTLKDQRLLPVHAYQEFWHSWQTFHPSTLQYLPSKQ
jgi:Protein of unknown function (DUF3179)